MLPMADPDDTGPTAAELAAIEREWPLIEAELALVDAEIRMLTAVGGPSPLDWRRLRRAKRRVMREALTLAAPERVTAVPGTRDRFPFSAVSPADLEVA